jgi:hypothetical protein
MDFEIGNWIEVEFVWLALVDSSSLFIGGFWNRLGIGDVWSNKRLVWKFKGSFKIAFNVSMKFDTFLINSIESSMSISHNKYKFNLNWVTMFYTQNYNW